MHNFQNLSLVVPAVSGSIPAAPTSRERGVRGDWKSPSPLCPRPATHRLIALLRQTGLVHLTFGALLALGYLL